MRLTTLLSSAVALASFFTPISAAALLAIDLGTDSLKASLVKPGVPFDVLVTKEGRRKTPSLVTLRKDDRSFGGEAANLVSRRAGERETLRALLARDFCSAARELTRMYYRLLVSLKILSQQSSCCSVTLHPTPALNCINPSTRYPSEPPPAALLPSALRRHRTPSKSFSRCSSPTSRRWQTRLQEKA